MSGKKANNLVLIENGLLSVVSLDNKTAWEVGRPSPDSTPDIKLRSATVSRKHGRFQNMDGIWFYVDYNGKNGTVYNHRHIEAGLKGRIKPILLKDGDVFVFGGGAKETINGKTVWGLFMEKEFDNNWRTADSKGMRAIKLISGDKETTLCEPEKGTVVAREDGIAIYMGDLTYMTGDMKLAEV